jgi:chromosome segregation ATPase
MSSEGSNSSGQARRGRPRKWASDAERKRAYRARKADELAEPERLRLELRDARSEVRRLEKQCARLEAVVRQAERQAAKEIVARDELETEIERRDGSIAFWERRARIAERQLWEIHHPGQAAQ